jgi:hypothetical protein
MLASSTIALMSSEAASVFLPSESEGSIFGHDWDSWCRTPIEQVIDAQHDRLDVRIVHTERIRHDAGGDNAYTPTTSTPSTATPTTTSTPTTSTPTAVMVLPVSHRKPI